MFGGFKSRRPLHESSGLSRRFAYLPGHPTSGKTAYHRLTTVARGRPLEKRGSSLNVGSLPSASGQGGIARDAKAAAWPARRDTPRDSASAGAAPINEEYRWDILKNVSDIVPGGEASALASDGSKITLTGSGTFRSNSDFRRM
jgi:hypothetical protein